MSRGSKKNPVGEWDDVLFRFIDELQELQYMYSETDLQPLGRLEVSGLELVAYSQGVVRVGTWIIRFESQPLAKKWIKVLRPWTERREEAIFVVGGEGKTDSQRAIEEMRNARRKLFRK